MRLSLYEENLLYGKQGEAGRLAMEILVRLGELYGAEEFIPITQAHIDGGLYAAVGEAGLMFAEKLAALGGKVVVPTTMNSTSRDIHTWREHRVDKEFAAKSARMEEAYLQMGALPNWTCAPYQAGIMPRFGEQIAWAESNAIAFVNSVIGARTERYGDYTDICCALTGRVPYFGLHRPENRRGQVLLDCSGLTLDSGRGDFAVLGYLTGKLVEDKIPVLKGIPARIGVDDLKAFSAAAASSGAVALYHMAGITPEARDVAAAFQGDVPESEIELTEDMLEQTRMSLCSGKKGASLLNISGELFLSEAKPEGKPDAILLGCPHASAAELIDIRRRMGGRSVPDGIEVWIYTNQTVYQWLSVTDVIQELENSGVKIIRDTCFVNTDLSQWNFRRVMTNSAKYAHYILSRTGVEVEFAGLEKCLQTALEISPGKG